MNRDLVEGYLFPDADGKRRIDQHIALGVSLGGHSVWQLMFAEPRVTAGVVVIGCPDYMSEFLLPVHTASWVRMSDLTDTDLLSDRARLSKLSTYSAQDDGASFIGSKDFPPSLVDACRKSDPKAIFFGASPVPDANASAANDENVRQILRDRLRGKKFLLCSGGEDKLVPYRCSEPFLQWFTQATGSWFKEEGVSVDNRVYPGVGHSFSADMITDSVQFVVDAVASADQGLPVDGRHVRSKLV
jgi:pimeloyl-ACP methyl ester carboxylesterase